MDLGRLNPAHEYSAAGNAYGDSLRRTVGRWRTSYSRFPANPRSLAGSHNAGRAESDYDLAAEIAVATGPPSDLPWA